MIIKSFQENKVNLSSQKIHLLYGENQGQIQDFIDQIFKKKNQSSILHYEENEIIKGPPLERRSFFNKVFSICSPTYLEILLSYNKILKQRNAVLKQQKKDKKKKRDLYSWNEAISIYGQKLWVYYLVKV